MLGDSSALSFQLDMYRWEDHVRRLRDVRERNAEQDSTDVVIAQYNDLVQRYATLAEAALKAGQAADASQDRVVAAEAQISLRGRELADLKQRQTTKNYELESSIEFWIRETEHYKARALAAEAELAELRSQHE